MSNDPKQSWFKQHKILTGVLGFILFIFIIAPYMDDGSDRPKTTVTPSGSITTNTKNSEKEVVEAKINNPIDLATHEMKVLSVREAQTMSSRYGKPVAAVEGTKFVIIELQVTSKSTSDFLYMPNQYLRLGDGEGRGYTTYDDTIGSIDNYLEVQTLSPSIPKKGVIVYEIPSDTIGYGLVAVNDATKQTTTVFLSTEVTK